MKSLIFILFVGIGLGVNGQHQDPTHNFTVQRLIIVNDANEMLMMREKHVWAPPSSVFNDRAFLTVSMDSLAAAYGIQIGDIELRGQFVYQYDYHPYATIRNYYVANYTSGAIRIPEGVDDVQWIPIQQAIDRNSVPSIKSSVAQIIKNPDFVWGGSFMVSHVGDDHPTKQVGAFYPLFGKQR